MELFEAGHAAVEEFIAEYQTQGSVARRAVASRPRSGWRRSIPKKALGANVVRSLHTISNIIPRAVRRYGRADECAGLENQRR
jgi:hypothetical protein